MIIGKKKRLRVREARNTTEPFRSTTLLYVHVYLYERVAHANWVVLVDLGKEFEVSDFLAFEVTFEVNREKDAILAAVADAKTLTVQHLGAHHGDSVGFVTDRVTRFRGLGRHLKDRYLAPRKPEQVEMIPPPSRRLAGVAMSEHAIDAA